MSAFSSLAAISKRVGLPALALLLSISACTVEADDAVPATAAIVDIDTDATLTFTPGEGVGVFVEYVAGGHWTISTTCDTNSSNAVCDFNLLVWPGSSTIRNAAWQNPDSPGLLSGLSDGSLNAVMNPTTETSAIQFDTAPGDSIELDVVLDGVEQPHYVYWVGNKVLHQGAPSNPIDFLPTTP